MQVPFDCLGCRWIVDDEQGEGLTVSLDCVADPVELADRFPYTTPDMKDDEIERRLLESTFKGTIWCAAENAWDRLEDTCAADLADERVKEMQIEDREGR